MSTLALHAYGATDVGRQRTHNEDCFFCDPDAGLFIVVDGVGGYAAGEVAAHLACDAISRRLQQAGGAAADRLREALTDANNLIYQHSQEHPEQHGMACVLTAAVVEHGHVTVGHVGDTRLYEVRRDAIRKVTRDHSPVGLREDIGDLSEMEAMNHPRRSEILRDLGSEPRESADEHFIDIYQFAWTPDSALLLCSDGLTDLVPKGAVHQILLDHAGYPDGAVQTLIEIANEMGGVDNITVVVVEGPAFAQPATVAPAETFEKPMPPREAAPPRARLPHPLRGRTAFFAYGGLVGCLVAVLSLALVYQGLAHRVPDAVAAPPSVRTPQTLHVAPDGSGAFQTIGAALAHAAPGDVVMVAPGLYSEAVRLKDSVAVVSAVPGAAVLRADRTLADSVVVAAYGIQGARLVGVKIDGAAGSVPAAVGLHLREAAVEVVDVEISGASRAGVFIEGAGEAVLRANLIADNPGSGVHVRGEAAQPRLVQNVISHNGAAHEAPGVLIEAGARPLLRRNVITGNAAEGIRLAGANGEASAQFRRQNFFLVDGERNTRRAVQTVMQ